MLIDYLKKLSRTSLILCAIMLAPIIPFELDLFFNKGIFSLAVTLIVVALLFFITITIVANLAIKHIISDRFIGLFLRIGAIMGLSVTAMLLLLDLGFSSNLIAYVLALVNGVMMGPGATILSILVEITGKGPGVYEFLESSGTGADIILIAAGWIVFILSTIVWAGLILAIQSRVKKFVK